MYMMRGKRGLACLALPSWSCLALPALPGTARHCPALPGHAWPCPALAWPNTGGGEGRLGWRGWESNSQYYLNPLILVGVTIYLAKFSQNISRGHYLPCNTYCLVLACIKAIFYIRPLRFCHDLANI
jgi:hypothetical protein